VLQLRMQLVEAVIGLTNAVCCVLCCAGSSCELIHLPLDGIAQQGGDSLIRSAAAGCFSLFRGPRAVHWLMCRRVAWELHLKPARARK
jgi:hypothetical protein